MTTPNPLVLDCLLSYAYHRSTDLAAMRYALGPDAVLVVDSGAFTAHTKGRVVDLDQYAEYVTRWSDVIDYAVTLDVIGDPVATERNTDALLARGVPVVPVFTIGTPLDYLDRLAADGHRLVYVGGLVGMSRPLITKYLRAVVARASRVGLLIHALGVGGVSTLTSTRAYSGDSSSATQAPSFGSVVVWTGTGQGQVRVSDVAVLHKHRDWLSGLGVPIADLVTGNVFRKDQKSIRDEVVKAGLWAYVVAGVMARHRTPTAHVDGYPDGPRILAALSSGDITLAKIVGALARTDPPPAVLAATRTTRRPIKEPA